MIVADLLYDGLTEADPTESTLRPALATTWAANDDATEWTFTLDTDRVQPDAVVAHVESLRGVAVGATAVVLDRIETVETVEGGAVRFTLEESNAGFPWLLSGVAFSMVGEGGELTGRYEITVDDEETLLLEAERGDRPDVAIEWHETARDAYNRLTVGAVDAAVVPPDALEDARSRYGVNPPARAISRFYVVSPRSARLVESGAANRLAGGDRPSDRSRRHRRCACVCTRRHPGPDAHRLRTQWMRPSLHVRPGPSGRARSTRSVEQPLVR